jgi:hypothetical protein
MFAPMAHMFFSHPYGIMFFVVFLVFWCSKTTSTRMNKGRSGNTKEPF